MIDNWAHSRAAERAVFPTAWAMLGPETLSFGGHGFGFPESYQDNYLICKIMKISEILQNPEL